MDLTCTDSKIDQINNLSLEDQKKCPTSGDQTKCISIQTTLDDFTNKTNHLIETSGAKGGALIDHSPQYNTSCGVPHFDSHDGHVGNSGPCVQVTLNEIVPSEMLNAQPRPVQPFTAGGLIDILDTIGKLPGVHDSLLQCRVDVHDQRGNYFGIGCIQKRDAFFPDRDNPCADIPDQLKLKTPP